MVMDLGSIASLDWRCDFVVYLSDSFRCWTNSSCFFKMKPVSFSSTKDKSLSEWSCDNFKCLPPLIQRDCIGLLKDKIPPEIVKELKGKSGEEIFDIPFFHFSWGMGIRNLLREIFLDEELPEIDGARNWDDYYMGALLAALEEM